MRPATPPFTCLLLLFANSVAAGPALECIASGAGDSLSVAVKIVTPHPGEMVINTPDGRMIWLQADHIPFPHPVTDDFVQLPGFSMNKKSRGSWFNDWGEPEVVAIFSTDGKYEIVITDDAESGRRNAGTLTCEFSVVTRNE